MEANFQTSFIPKKPIVEERTTAARPIGFLTIVAIFILFTVVLGSGGLYIYKSITVKNIITLKNNLNLAKGRFEPKRIEDLKLLDKRLTVANQILSKHIAVSPIFEALQAITTKNVRYTKFGYEFSGGKDQRINVKMSGTTLGYSFLALQSDLFATNKNFIDPVFSNLSLNESGNVTFDLTFSVDPAFVDYKSTLLTTTNPTSDNNIDNPINTVDTQIQTGT